MRDFLLRRLIASFGAPRFAGTVHRKERHPDADPEERADPMSAPERVEQTDPEEHEEDGGLLACARALGRQLMRGR